MMGLAILGLYFSGRLLHTFLALLGQPRMISEALIGLLIGNTPLLEALVGNHANQLLEAISEYTMGCYMFVLGLEMDPESILRRPGREAIIGYTSTISTIVISMVCTVLPTANFIPEMRSPITAISLVLVFANTASPLLTRLITELKMGKSEIGRLVIGASIHNDMTSTLLMCTWIIFTSSTDFVTVDKKKKPVLNMARVISIVIALFLQTVLIRKVMPRFFFWVNNENPEGKHMKGTHLVLTFTTVFFIWAIGIIPGYRGTLNAFIVGLALPREGRLSRQLVSKINFVLRILLLPIFFVFVGRRVQMKMWQKIEKNEEGSGGVSSWQKLLSFIVMGTVGKVIGIAIVTCRMGFKLPEGLGMGLLMNLKGHYHILCALDGLQNETITEHTFLVILLHILLSVVNTPLVVAMIVRRAKNRALDGEMALQWHNPSKDLRIVVCLYGPHNLPTAINLIEATRGGTHSAPLTVYAMDMIELTGSSTLTYREGIEGVTVNDEAITGMRDQMTSVLEEYVQESGEGVTIRRLLALSSYENMHADVFNGARDVMAVFIILPFHRRLMVDGTMEDHSALRDVNKRVLQSAPCSVGILVDRGLGGTNLMSAAYASHQVAVIFIGGCDDCEAMAYASRMAYHPGVKLTAIRLMQDPDTEFSTDGGSARIMEKETDLDDQFLAEFNDRHVKNGPVAYFERYVANGPETVATLNKLEEHYSLFIVGLAGRGSSVLTTGMDEWQEFPELGPLGDILAGSDFSVKASALIIQQHNNEKHREKYGDNLEEFSVYSHRSVN
ncbi:cation/hydrogen exchanger 28 [Tasmannia lanceolata]|uniref:cation/hydrogen exchanger 28 n=1 Tax=Tasmannia lanceolata TaxID=3420 RepID=UPI004064ACB7